MYLIVEQTGRDRVQVRSRSEFRVPLVQAKWLHHASPWYNAQDYAEGMAGPLHIEAIEMCCHSTCKTGGRRAASEAFHV